MRRALVTRAFAALVLALVAAGCDSDPSGPQGPRCGPTVCRAGTECCNASCGTCVPPGSACTLQFCGQSPCASDAECRTFSFACTDCVCWAIRVDDPQPSCPGTPVNCIVDPCRNRSARCDPATRRCALQ